MYMEPSDDVDIFSLQELYLYLQPTTFSSCSFPVVASIVWNKLPPSSTELLYYFSAFKC